MVVVTEQHQVGEVGVAAVDPVLEVMLLFPGGWVDRLAGYRRGRGGSPSYDVAASPGWWPCAYRYSQPSAMTEVAQSRLKSAPSRATGV